MFTAEYGRDTTQENILGVAVATRTSNPTSAVHLFPLLLDAVVGAAERAAANLKQRNNFQMCFETHTS
jgi:hypothetical protein